jgi:hypothetical protein
MFLRLLLVAVCAAVLAQVPALYRYATAARDIAVKAHALQDVIDDRHARIERALAEAK